MGEEWAENKAWCESRLRARADDDDSQKTPEVSPIPCLICRQWLNGQGQYTDHLAGTRHRKNLQKALRKYDEALVR